MKLMIHLVYLFLWLRATWGQSLVCSNYPVQALYSEETVLQCHLDPPQNATDKTVKWSRGADVVHVYQKGQDVPAEQKESFEGRTSLFRDGLTRGNLSLRLSTLQLHDSGRYTCAFITETQERSCYVNLTVGEPEVIGSNVSLTAEVGGNITLPCHLEPPFDVKNLTVEWRHNNSIVHMYRSRRDDPIIQDKSYKKRTSMFHDKLSEGNISLILINVTVEDSGVYICHVPKLHSQVRKGNVTLKVGAQKEEGSRVNSDSSTDKTGTIGGGVVVGVVVVGVVVVGVVGGLLLVAAVIYWRCRGEPLVLLPNIKQTATCQHTALSMSYIMKVNSGKSRHPERAASCHSEPLTLHDFKKKKKNCTFTGLIEFTEPTDDVFKSGMLLNYTCFCVFVAQCHIICCVDRGAGQNQREPDRQPNNGEDLPLNPLPGQEEQNMQLRQEAVPQDPLLGMGSIHPSLRPAVQGHGGGGAIERK